MRDLNFFYDSAINDLNAGQVTRATIGPLWPESDIEIMEQELRKEQENAKSKRFKRQ